MTERIVTNDEIIAQVKISQAELGLRDWNMSALWIHVGETLGISPHRVRHLNGWTHGWEEYRGTPGVWIEWVAQSDHTEEEKKLLLRNCGYFEPGEWDKRINYLMSEQISMTSVVQTDDNGNVISREYLDGNTPSYVPEN